VHEKRAHNLIMHSCKAYWYRPTMDAQRDNAPSRAHHHSHAVHRNITSIFAGTTCSVDATLIKRPEGLPRFPDYDPAPRSAPREMRILYQKIACANGADFGVWSVAERRTPFETAKIHAAGANELSPKVAGTSRGTWRVPPEVHGWYLARWTYGTSRAKFRISRPLRRVRRPRPTAAEVPRRRHDSPIGQAYGGLRYIPIGL